MRKIFFGITFLVSFFIGYTYATDGPSHYFEVDPVTRFYVSQHAKQDWEKTNELYFLDCFDSTDFTDYNGTNILLRFTICSFIKWYSKKFSQLDIGFYHHSDRRYISQHKLGNAIDFHIRNYVPLNRCETLKAFKTDARAMELYFKRMGIWELIGWAIYANQQNPFVHLDFRGNKKARWARNQPTGTNYVGIAAGWKWLDKAIAKECRQ